MLFRVDANRIGENITEKKNLQSSQVQGKSTPFLLAKADEKSEGCRLFLLLLISTRGDALVLLQESFSLGFSCEERRMVLCQVVAVSSKRLILMGTFSWLGGEQLAAGALPVGEFPGRELPGKEPPGREFPGGELPGRELLAREHPKEEIPG